MWMTAWNYAVGWVRQESAAATALVQAFIALGIAFAWWHWSSAQTGAVVGIVAALLAMFVRSQVTPLHPLKDNRPGRAPRTIHSPTPAAGSAVPGPAAGPTVTETRTLPEPEEHFGPGPGARGGAI